MDIETPELILLQSESPRFKRTLSNHPHDSDCGNSVTWLSDDENERLDMSMNLNAANLFFNRVNSAEIIYQAKKKNCKMIGKYVMGDKLGEG